MNENPTCLHLVEPLNLNSARVANDLDDINLRLAMLMANLADLEQYFPGNPRGLRLWLDHAAMEPKDIEKDLRVLSQFLHSAQKQVRNLTNSVQRNRVRIGGIRPKENSR